MTIINWQLSFKEFLMIIYLDFHVQMSEINMLKNTDNKLIY